MRLAFIFNLLTHVVRPFSGDAAMLCTYEIMFSSMSLMVDLKNNLLLHRKKLEIVTQMKVINIVHACIWSPYRFYMYCNI